MSNVSLFRDCSELVEESGIMQMLPEIHWNSRTGCNYDSLGLFARFFQDGNGLPEHWNTNPLVEAEKKTINKVKSLKHTTVLSSRVLY